MAGRQESYEAITIPSGYEVSSLYAAKNGDEVVGYCVTASANGYNGPVAVNLGVGADGLVTGCAVGDTSFAETPGFGARAKARAIISRCFCPPEKVRAPSEMTVNMPMAMARTSSSSPAKRMAAQASSTVISVPPAMLV